METFYFFISFVLILISVLPFIKNQHWVFRVPEFIKIQILVVQVAILLVGVFFADKSLNYWIITGIQLLLTGYHTFILFHYTKFYKKLKIEKEASEKDPKIKVISANVYQFNKDYSLFQRLIRKVQPDIFVTIESHSAWEQSNRVLEKDYPHTHKITLENTYGMHLYSKLEFSKVKTHFFVEDDLPSIEAHFKIENKDFVLFAVHPPPPSPTEETTSKERDSDLMCIAKRVKKINKPRLVIGDFNTVSWSNASKLFKKNSELIDARLGRGILSTFHAKYWFFRVPLDLLFHSADIHVLKLETLENIGSDHFPVYCEFSIADDESAKQKEEIEHASTEEKAEAEELIDEGRKATSDNR